MNLLIGLMLVLAIVAVYGQVGSHAFVTFDTPDYVTRNPFVKAGLTGASIAWAFTTTHAANWHPVTWLSHMADVQVFGLHPGAHHMTSVLLHILNTLLLFAIFKRMTGRLWPSAFIALLFALHPLHVESIAWVAERKDLLCAFFGFLMLWRYVRYVEQPGPGRYLAVVLFFILGLMSKPMLITFPFVLLLLDFWPFKRLVSDKNAGGRGLFQRHRRLPALIVEKTPLILLAIASSLVTVAAQHTGGAVRTLTAYPLVVRMGNALVAYVVYITKMICPTRLAFFYPHQGAALSGWVIAGAAIGLLGVTILIVKHTRQRPYLFVGWFWYIGTLVPVIGIVQVGLQSWADRYTYIPFIGLYLMLAFGLAELTPARRSRRYVLTIAGIAIVLLLGVRAWHQVGVWQDSESLYRHALAVTRNNYVAHKNLGLVLAEKGDISGALKAYNQAIKHHPYPHSVYYSAGNALLQINKYQEAERYYFQALKLKSDFALAYYGLGLLAAQEGHTDKALRNYGQALEHDPDLAEAELNTGVVYLSQGRLEKAVVHLQRALAINPYMARAHNNIGLARVRQARFEPAIMHFEKALAYKSDYRQARSNLQRVHTDQKRIARAVANLQAALELDITPSAAADRLRQPHAELMVALHAFQKAMAGQPGFTAESLANLKGVTEVLQAYDQATQAD